MKWLWTLIFRASCNTISIMTWWWFNVIASWHVYSFFLCPLFVLFVCQVPEHNIWWQTESRCRMGWWWGQIVTLLSCILLPYLQHIPSILLLLPFYLSRGLLGPGNPLFSQHGICFMEGELGILCGNFPQTDTEHSD